MRVFQSSENISILYRSLLFLFLSFGFSIFLTPLVMKFAINRKIVAHQDIRRRHQIVTPLLGGIPTFISLFLVSISIGFFGFFPNSPGTLIHLTWFLGPLAMMFFLGVLDDFNPLSAQPKFTVQLIAVTIFLYGVAPLIRSQGLGTFGFYGLVLFLAVFMVAVTNSINLIDGIDGLCAGNAIICAISYVVISSATHHYNSLAVFFGPALVGSCLGFLHYNMRPARIFLGDSGSLTIGFFLAAAGVELGLRGQSLANITVPMIALGLSLLDVTLVVYLRARAKRSIFSGDRNHLHHRLQRLGLKHPMVLTVLFLGSLYFNLLAIELSFTSLVGIPILLMAMLVVLLIGVVGLAFVEKRLAIQTSKFGHAGLEIEFSENLNQNDPLLELQNWAVAQGTSVRRFQVLVVDHLMAMPLLFEETPSKVDQFFRHFYDLLTECAQDSNQVIRVSNNMTLVLFVDGPERNSQDLLAADVVKKIADLHLKFGISMSDHVYAEGVTLLSYPKDVLKLSRAFNCTVAELRESLNDLPGHSFLKRGPELAPEVIQ